MQEPGKPNVDPLRAEPARSAHLSMTFSHGQVGMPARKGRRLTSHSLAYGAIPMERGAVAAVA
jgi:hypothetical protein